MNSMALLPNRIKYLQIFTAFADNSKKWAIVRNSKVLAMVLSFSLLFLDFGPQIISHVVPAGQGQTSAVEVLPLMSVGNQRHFQCYQPALKFVLLVARLCPSVHVATESIGHNGELTAPSQEKI